MPDVWGLSQFRKEWKDADSELGPLGCLGGARSARRGPRIGAPGGVVAKDVWSAIMLEETKTFCVVKPRNFACVLRHWKPDFLCSLDRTSIEQYETYGVCRSFVRGERTSRPGLPHRLVSMDALWVN